MLSFSIVIPSYSRQAALAACLQAVAGLDYPRDLYEVIVVYDGPSPAAAAPPPGLRLRQLGQPHAGPAAARNRGAAVAGGEFLAFLDDDCQPERRWLQALGEVLSVAPDRLVGGLTHNMLADNLFSAASQDLVDYLYAYLNGDPAHARFLTSNNLAVRRDLFLACGGFDVSFTQAGGEDREFCRRWLAGGRGIVYVPAARIDHAHSTRLRSFWRQHCNYGRGAWRFHAVAAREQGDGVRVQIERPRFYMDLLRYPFARRPWAQALAVASLLVLAQVANAVGFWRGRREERSS